MTSNTPYERERQIAELAIQRARILAEKVLSFVDKGELSKSDDSPVSLADFGAQALLVAAIHTAFPEDSIIGEENADALRANPKMMKQVWDLVSSTRLSDETSEALLGRPESMEEMCKFIDIGGTATESGKGRVWAVDPVDGTKPFLAGTQYALLVALLIDGIDQLGVIGCPRLDWPSGKLCEEHVAKNGPGYIVSGVRGYGVQIRQMTTGALLPAVPVNKRPPRTDLNNLRYTENIRPKSRRFPHRELFAERLGAPWPPVNIFSSSMTYVALALGLSDYQVRCPLPTASPSAIWDHAGGILIFEEMGGKVTDLRGKNIDLSLGRYLSGNWGNLGADAGIHDKVLATVREIFKPYPEYANKQAT